ncbi:MAG: hypothetical protein ACSI46_22820 [Gloeotrichia echinulata DVL01]|jgi:hypothetical protein|nr:hypothetical protein [Gloeotrichia echinulata DEX184]
MRQGLTVPGGSVRTAKIYQYLVIFVVDDIVGARYESRVKSQESRVKSQGSRVKSQDQSLMTTVNRQPSTIN